MQRIIGFLTLLLTAGGCMEASFENTPDNQTYVFDAFWREIDRNYSFFPYSTINWDSVRSAMRPAVSQTISDDSLFHSLARATDMLHDAHTNVYTPKGIGGSVDYFEKFPVNEITLDVDAYFDFYVAGRIFDYGKLKSTNIGYIKIKTFEGAQADFEKADAILKALAVTDKIIIDVRSNFGGKISNSMIIANRIADAKHYAGQYRIRNGPKHSDFTAWINLYVSPPNNTPFTKPVIILTNRRSFSATEWFILLADALPNVTTLGDTTGGGSAMPIWRELPNGWMVRISNTQFNLPGARDFQHTGMYPDVPVWITPADQENGKDTILETAMK